MKTLKNSLLKIKFKISPRSLAIPNNNDNIVFINGDADQLWLLKGELYHFIHNSLEHENEWRSFSSQWLSDKKEEDFLVYLQFLVHLKDLGLVEFQDKINADFNNSTKESFLDFCLIENNLEKELFFEAYAQSCGETRCNYGSLEQYFCDGPSMQAGWTFTGMTC